MGLLLQNITVAGEPGMVKVRDLHHGNSDGFEKVLGLSMQGAKKRVTQLATHFGTSASR